MNKNKVFFNKFLLLTATKPFLAPELAGISRIFDATQKKQQINEISACP